MKITAQFTKLILQYCLVIGIWLLVIPTTIVSAQDMSLIVSPPRIDLDVKPGEVIQKTIKVTNKNTDRELILRAYPVDFIVEDDQGTPIKVDSAASGRYLSSPWFTLEREELVIPPGATDQLAVVVTVPADALPGGHYTGIYFQPLTARGQKTTISYTAIEVGSLFGLTVAGDIKYDALIKDFSVKSQLVEFGPVDFSATIENQSDTHIRPNVTIEIRDMIGRPLTNVNLEEVNIFPFTARTLKGAWETVWGLGRYTATLSAAYGPGLVASRTLYFWIVPYRLLAALGVILLVLLTLYILIRRHLLHRADVRDSEIDELKRKIAEMENRQR